MKNDNITSYGQKFYDDMANCASHASSVTVPIILNAINPKSVVDVGCGTGSWARSFINAGIDDVIGVDGNWVLESDLVIQTEKFVRADLAHPLIMKRKFDLCVCLETAEHFPESRAAGLVSDLTALADIVVFSAAIPFQGGTHHFNEKWQCYWADLFAANGYVGVDYLRRRIWHLNKFHSWFYAQNIMIYVKASSLEQHSVLANEYKYQDGTPLSIVHPGLLILLQPWHKHLTTRAYFSMLPHMIGKVFNAIIRRITRQKFIQKSIPNDNSEWHSAPL